MSEPLTAPGAVPEHHDRLRQRADGVVLACGVATLAGLIHIQAAIDHFAEYVPYAILFIALAGGQLVWSLAYYRWPARRLLYAGMIGCVGVIAAWIASRTIGLPFGPDLGHPEPVGVLDGIATIDEVVIVALALSILRGSRARLANSAALLMIVVSSLVLAGGLHAH
jgi:hypothetical protein